MWVKICANTRLEDAALAAELGADAVGFVFAPSKRRVNAAQVAGITKHLPESVEKVGVFTTTDAEEIVETARAAGLTAVQLHSEFDPVLVEAIDAKSGGTVRVLQVVDVPQAADIEGLRGLLTEVLGHPYVVAALLDASHGGTSGGTGKTFNWQQTAEMVRRVKEETDGQIIVAGGLNAKNVGAAIAEFAPWGVDVASGVEASYGVKDAGKMREFLRAARGAAR
jgi:phosphoribosylanthranilate isomerase